MVRLSLSWIQSISYLLQENNHYHLPSQFLHLWITCLIQQQKMRIPLIYHAPKRSFLNGTITQGIKMWIIQKMILHKALPSIPVQLAWVKEIPKCTACLQGKACKHSHNKHQGEIGHVHTVPGLGVSIDHDVAGQPCFLWQTKSAPMNHWYK